MFNKLKQFFTYAKREPIEATIPIVCFCGVFVYGSTKPPSPPPAVIEKGITITEQTVDAEGITIKWKSEDERIVAGETVFIIEAREKPMVLGKTVVFRPTNTEWYEIGRTKDFELAKPGVWTDKTREIRVRTVIEGAAE